MRPRGKKNSVYWSQSKKRQKVQIFSAIKSTAPLKGHLPVFIHKHVSDDRSEQRNRWSLPDGVSVFQSEKTKSVQIKVFSPPGKNSNSEFVFVCFRFVSESCFGFSKRHFVFLVFFWVILLQNKSLKLLFLPSLSFSSKNRRETSIIFITSNHLIHPELTHNAMYHGIRKQRHRKAETD